MCSSDLTFTVVVAGMPNVGKSTFVSRMTTAKPRVESYPFTTQKILLGYFEKDRRKYQVVDTPGLLDRPLDRRNKVEKQAILALRHLADVILYLFDLSEFCGYPVGDQLGLYNEILHIFDIPVIPVINKSDLMDSKVIGDFSKKIEGTVFSCSSLKEEGIDEIIEMITEINVEKE